MKQEITNTSNEQIKRYEEQARILRSQEISRLASALFRMPMRMTKRWASSLSAGNNTIEQNG